MAAISAPPGPPAPRPAAAGRLAGISPGLRRRVASREARPSQLALLLRAQTESLLAMVLAFPLYAAAGAVFLLVYGIRLTEPAVQTTAIWQTVWSPRPSFPAALALFEPLFLLLSFPFHFIEPVRVLGVAPVIASALSGALAVGAMNSLLRFYRLSPPIRWATLLTFALNPVWLFLAGSGAPITLGVALTTLTIALMVRWMQRETITWLIGGGAAAGLLTLAALDAVLIAALFALAVAFYGATDRPSPGRISALVITYGVPVVFVFSAWPLVSWFAITDPFHFLELGPLLPILAAQWGSLIAAPTLSADLGPLALEVASVVGALAPLAVGGLASLVAVWGFRPARRSMVAAVCGLAVLVHLVLALVTGNPIPFVRAWPLLLPIGVWVACEAALGYGGPAPALWRQAVLAVACVAAIGLTGWTLAVSPPTYPLGLDEMLRVARNERTSPTLQALTDVARQIPTLTPGPIMVDLTASAPLMLLSERPDLYLHYDSPLLPPPRARTRAQAPDAVLVRNPTLNRDGDAFSQRYPAFYEFGAEWAELIGRWDGLGWRLYRIER